MNNSARFLPRILLPILAVLLMASGCTVSVTTSDGAIIISPASTSTSQGITVTQSFTQYPSTTSTIALPTVISTQPTIITTSLPRTTLAISSVPTTAKSNISVALDYFGIKNTHWVDQGIGGSPTAQIQMVVILSDATGTLATWPPDPTSQTFAMDFFQVIPLKNYMGGNSIFYSGPVAGTLSLRVIANNVNKGAITKAQIDLIKTLGGGDLSYLKSFIPDQELIGTYWQTWPTTNLGVGSQFTYNDNSDLKIWGRIGTPTQMPIPIQQPILTPDVKIESVNLPSSAKIRSQYFFNESSFSFTIANYESFAFPIYWHLETTANLGTTITPLVYPTSGVQTVLAKGRVTVSAKYWFTSPGNFKWTYILADAGGNTIDSWTGTLLVSS